MVGAVPPMTRPVANSASPASIGRPSGTRSASVPATTIPIRLDSMNALNTQPYRRRSPRSRLTTGRTVAMAKASDATRVTASTSPTVSERRPGVQIPPADGPGGVCAGRAAWSVLTPCSVEPQPQLTSIR